MEGDIALVTDPTNRHPEHTEEGVPSLIALIRRELRSSGPMTFARFMDLALYHPTDGYYLAATRRPGRGGDFITAPELHPFFGLTLARQVAECWDRLGQPDPFTIREYGSGIGGLAWDVIGGLLTDRPELRQVLRYRLAEINPHRTVEALAAMTAAGLDDLVGADDGEPITGVVLANEVADALPVHRLIVRDGTLREQWVAEGSSPSGFVEVEAELSPEIIAHDVEGQLARSGVRIGTLPDGARLDVSPASIGWISALAAGLARGYALIIDYGYPAAELYLGHRLEGTVRGYREHTVTDDPFVAIGDQDLTAHVDFSALGAAAERAGLTIAGLTTQADALAQIGLGERLVQLQREPDVAVDEYYRAQAAVFRLIDPAGLGRFRVLGLARAAPVDPPLRAFSPPDLPPGLRFDRPGS